MVREYIRSGHALPKFWSLARDPRNRGDGHSEDDRFWRHFVELFPADVYVFDPMRSLHTGDENDSAIEGLLSAMRSLFRDSAVVIVHHTRKRTMGVNSVSLEKDMRLWSDAARGSSALKAHADTIVCQERKIDAQGNEIVHLGAFSKDAPDVDPIALEETDAESFLWAVRADAPTHLTPSLDRLNKKGGRFKNVADAVKTLEKEGVKRPTAYRHVNGLMQVGILTSGDTGLVVRKAGNGKR